MLFLVFCFKQKTAYEMRISDWSSDVCSSDLLQPTHQGRRAASGARAGLRLFPKAEGTPKQFGGLHLRRRAADDGDRPRDDGQAEHAPARRAVDGPRTADRCRDL